MPDGIIPTLWWVLGYLLTFSIMFFIFKSMDQEEARKKIPFTGIAAAIMLLGMSVPLVIVPVHLSLAVMTGILIGPKLGFLAVFVVNIILAFFGHGGITIVGLNTLIIGSEVFIGYYLFKYFTQNINKVVGTVMATVLALLVSTTLMVGVVGITAGLTEALPHHHDEEHLQEVQHLEESYDDHDHQHNHGQLSEEVAKIEYFTFAGWKAVFLILAMGILLESLGTALIVKYFLKVRPDLIMPTKDI